MAAPKGNNFNPKGRPQKPIDWEEFQKLCEIQCTQLEMASFFGISPDTLSDRTKDYYQEDYSIIYKRFSEGGKCSLRRTQLKLAQKNTAMSIWLGKQWLGQKENIPETQVNDEINKRFVDVMSQIMSLQSSARKIDASSINSDIKSE